MALFRISCLLLILLSGNLLAQKNETKIDSSELHPAYYIGAITPQRFFSGAFRGDLEYSPKKTRLGFGLGIEGIQGVDLNLSQEDQIRGFGFEPYTRIYSSTLEIGNYSVTRSFFSFGYYYQHLKQNANFIRLEEFQENGITLFREIQERDFARLNRIGISIMGGFQRVSRNNFLFEGYFGTTFMRSRIKEENNLGPNNFELFSRDLNLNYDVSGFIPRIGFKFGFIF